ncbi:MAG: hypothetical protein LKF44_08860 [Atopobiaceae bacterium]|jgi:hypothetical protein|nr:hypothetical protein [Atopobiaceae bacterium]
MPAPAPTPDDEPPFDDSFVPTDIDPLPDMPAEPPLIIANEVPDPGTAPAPSPADADAPDAASQDGLAGVPDDVASMLTGVFGDGVRVIAPGPTTAAPATADDADSAPDAPDADPGTSDFVDDADDADDGEDA